MSKPCNIRLPLLHPAGGFGEVIIDRDLWEDGDPEGSLCRQVDRDQAQGITISEWILDYARQGREALA